MVERVTAFQALDGSLHATWDEAAAVQGAAIFAALLPNTIDGDRAVIGAELARHFFIDRNDQMLAAVVQLQELMLSAPKDTTQSMAARFGPNVEDISDRRGWFGAKR